MPPKKQKGGKGKAEDWDDDAAEKKLAKLAVKDESDKEEAFSESEEEAPPPKPKNRMAAFQMLDDDSDNDSEKQSDDEAPAKVKSPVKAAEPKKEKKDNKKKKDKGKKKDEDDDLDELLANLDKKEEKVGKKAKKKEKQAAAAAAAEGEEEGEAAPAAAAAEATPEPAAEKPEGDEEDEGKKKKKKNKKKKGGKGDEDADGEEKKEDEEKEDEEEAEKPDEELTEEELKKREKKRKEKEKKKEKEKAKKEKGKEAGGKKTKHVDMIKELLRAKQEAEEAEAARLKEENDRIEAAMAAQEEEERIRKEKKEAEKLRKQEKIDEQKRAGTYLTPAQRAKLMQTQAKLAAANIQLPARDDDEEGAAAAAEKPKKRIIYDTKKKGKGPAQKDAAAAEKPEEKSVTPEESKPATPSPPPVAAAVVAAAAPAAAPAAAEAAKEAAWDEEPVDDWELADELPKIAAAPSAVAAAAAAAAPAKPAAAKKTAAAAAKHKSTESKEESDSSSEESSSEDDSSEEESSSEESSSGEEEEEKKGGNKRETKEEIAERVKLRLKKRRETAQAKRSTDNLRAPVICVLGHVDTGKTKMLDTIRRTNVQDGEAGGITQQIGATQVPGDAIKERCKMVKDFDPEKLKIPGFLIIDTPGHESFSNLRSRGSSLCDYAILVVDIMHGLEPQTIESLKLLLKRGTPFVIALNKIDRLYGYESNPRKDVYLHLKSQPHNAQMEFQERYNKIVGEFAEQGVNVILSNKNRNEDEYISMVPTSAFLGDGVGNIMAHIALTTQTRFAEKMAFCEELDATVMEVKMIPGLGTTIDVILVNGELNVGDIIVVTGSDGAIMTPVRDLLMPQPLREMRVRNEYTHFKKIKGAQGVKILAKGLEKALAGLPLFVAEKDDEVDYFREEAEAQLSKALTSIKRKPEGVYVQASTLGSLEALLEFLKSQKIPYSNVNIGPVHKRDVQKAAVMMEHNPEYACILAFDVKIEKDAQQFADHEGVKIFAADIIYHLEDNFLKYREELRLKARKEHEHLAIFPCKLRVLPQHVFNARNPIVCGVAIEAGVLKKGTPICVPSKEGIFLGAISSIERNHEQVDTAKAGEEVCIKIENTTGEAPKLYGRHFTHEDALVSRITRESIDVCKTHFRDDLNKNDWQLVVQLKKLLDIF